MNKIVKFYALAREYKKNKVDIIVDWDTSKLCIYDEQEIAQNVLKEYKKYYPTDKAKIIVITANVEENKYEKYYH